MSFWRSIRDAKPPLVMWELAIVCAVLIALAFSVCFAAQIEYRLIDLEESGNQTIELPVGAVIEGVAFDSKMRLAVRLDPDEVTMETRRIRAKQFGVPFDETGGPFTTIGYVLARTGTPPKAKWWILVEDETP